MMMMMMMIMINWTGKKKRGKEKTMSTYRAYARSFDDQGSREPKERLLSIFVISSILLIQFQLRNSSGILYINNSVILYLTSIFLVF